MLLDSVGVQRCKWNCIYHGKGDWYLSIVFVAEVVHAATKDNASPCVKQCRSHHWGCGSTVGVRSSKIRTSHSDF